MSSEDVIERADGEDEALADSVREAARRFDSEVEGAGGTSEEGAARARDGIERAIQDADPRTPAPGPAAGGCVAMRFRLELFVEDLAASVACYERALGFGVTRREPQYASLRRGDAELGLVPVAGVPVRAAGPGFDRPQPAGRRGAGVEIVLEVEDLAAALDAVERAGVGLAEPPRDRPWGLRDFRLVDPDGYCLRVTTT